jgi:23S rRNA (cytosine1962-C5)-methyltransferase
MKAMNTIQTILPTAEYALIDSGAGEKLERYGDIIVSRPDPQALWPKAAPESEWKKATAVFHPKSGWQLHASVPPRWKISLNDLSFWIKPSAFKHTGVFPEHMHNWKWIEKTIRARSHPHPTHKEGSQARPLSVLNLFGYTGGATMAAAAAGAEVCHVDGSKTSVAWAKDNAALSGFGEKPIRWIVDDARAFLKREIKRGRHYDAIIMDPPIFGRGPNGEVWKIEEHFIELLELVKKVLVEKPVFILLNGYAAGYSAEAYRNSLAAVWNIDPAKIDCGELALVEQYDHRLLSAGIYARTTFT